MGKNLKYISVLLSAALAASAMSLGGFAVSDLESGSISVRYAETNAAARLRGEVSISYQEATWSGNEVTYTSQTADCTAVESSTEAVTWYDGCYVVSGEVNITEPITVSGAVNLILADGCTLNANSGIVVETGNSLTIYAQENGTGTLNATGTTDSDYNAGAGIGGSTSSVDSGAITIHGGVINATGGTTNPNNGFSGAGIGGGSPNSGNGGNSGAITIYGGTVTANSGAGNVTGAGIGGGASGNDGNGGTGSNIVIYGGNVTASSTGTDTGGAGIGGGSGVDNGGVVNNIQIYGGTVNATGGNLGAGIGGGGCGSSADSSHKAGNGTVTISGGKVTAVGGKYAAGIGGGGGYYYSISYSGVSISGGCIGGTGSVTISGGIVDATGGVGNSSGNYAGDPIGNGGNAGDTAATVTISEGHAVYQNGAPVEKGTEVTGAVTVKQCGHEEIEVQDNGDGTHGMNCPYCGYSYSHDTALTATADNNVITVREACDTCGYGKDLGTVTIHIPEIVYGDLTKEISAETTLETFAVVYVKVDNTTDRVVLNPNQSYSLTMAYLTNSHNLAAGEHTLTVTIFIDVNSDPRKAVECDLPFTIDKATLTTDGTGTADGTYGTALSELQITGITAKLNDTEIAGKWEFTDTTLPNSGKSVRKAVFVPTTGADNFKELSADVTLNISKAQGILNLTDTTLNKKFGTDSKFSLESYCTTDSDGVISYTTDSAAVTVSQSGEVTIIGAGEAVITVSLAEGTNYTAAEDKTITINIEQADNPSNLPSSVMNVSQRIENLKDVSLPENWQWQNEDTALETEQTIEATAEYIGADKDNYKNLTVTVEVTRSNCNHDNTELRNTVDATCQHKGYTGDTYCTDCDTLMLYGNETPLADHTSDNGTVTKQPTTSETGERTYKCTVCGCVIRTETIAKLPSGGSGGSGSSGGSTRPSEPTEPETPSLPDSEVPFIKDENGKSGWEVINGEIDKAENGGTVTVDMNGAAVVPGNVFDTLKGRDVIVVFDMGEGITWSVNGKDITSDKVSDIDLSVKSDTKNIPVNVVNNITGERYSIQISLAYNGEFGFKAVLSINLGSGNAGQKAALYYYNDGSLELMCESEISSDGTANLTFTHASDYLIVIGESKADDNSGNSSNSSDSSEDNNSDDTSSGDDNSDTTSTGNASEPGKKDPDGQGENPSTGVAASLIPFAIAAAFITVSAKRKKKK